jgi:hypothetical protein
MENLRYLFVAIAALTLIMSVVSGVNPNYFAGLSAFADHEDEEEDDDNSGSNDDHEEEDDEKSKGKDKDDDELIQSLGNHSEVTLEVDDDHVDLEVEIEDGDLADGQHDVVFACTSPDIDEEFADALDVEGGAGDFETEIALANGTYTGCEVDVGGLSATFASFTIVPEEEDEEDDYENEEHEEESEDEEEEEHEREAKSKLKTEDDAVEIEVEVEGLNMTDGSYDAVFVCEVPALNMTLDDAFEVEDDEGEFKETIGFANGTYSGCDITVEGTVIASFNTFTVSEETEEEQEHEVEEKRKEKRERTVTTINGTTIHERHRGQNPSSPGEYQPGWNYTLVANGTADDADAKVDIDMAVWKSNRAIILLDVIDGTIKVDNQTYTVVLGYAFYTIHHDTFRVGALAVDDDGNVYKLKMRGSAEDDAEFPMESGSIELTFEGSSGPSNNRFGDWDLTLDGTVEAD